MLRRALMAPCRSCNISRSDGEVAEKICGLERCGPEAADGDDGAIDRERRNDDVDARAVGETGVHHRRRFIDAAANSGDDLVDDVHEVHLVLEGDPGLFKDSGALDVDGVVRVDQDVVDGRDPAAAAQAGRGQRPHRAPRGRGDPFPPC